MNMLLIILAVCTDVGREMPCISRNFHNFCGCRDKPEDDEWLNCSIVELAQLQSSKSHVSLQYVMLCTIPLSTTSSSASTDDVSGVSTSDVSGVSTGDVSGDSTDDVSSSCVSVEKGVL